MKFIWKKVSAEELRKLTTIRSWQRSIGHLKGPLIVAGPNYDKYTFNTVVFDVITGMLLAVNKRGLFDISGATPVAFTNEGVDILVSAPAVAEEPLRIPMDHFIPHTDLRSESLRLVLAKAYDALVGAKKQSVREYNSSVLHERLGRGAAEMLHYLRTSIDQHRFYHQAATSTAHESAFIRTLLAMRFPFARMKDKNLFYITLVSARSMIAHLFRLNAEQLDAFIADLRKEAAQRSSGNSSRIDKSLRASAKWFLKWFVDFRPFGGKPPQISDEYIYVWSEMNRKKYYHGPSGEFSVAPVFADTCNEMQTAYTLAEAKTVARQMHRKLQLPCCVQQLNGNEIRVVYGVGA